MLTTLDKIPNGTIATIKNIDISLQSTNRLKELGLSPDSHITPLFCGPVSNIKAFYIKGTVIALRRDTTRKIHVLTNTSR